MENSKILNFEEAMLDPIFAEFRAELIYAKEHLNELRTSGNYMQVVKNEIEMRLEKLAETSPELTLGAVVAKVSEALPDILSGKQILELTKHTIETWEKLQVEQPAQLLEAA